MYSVYSHASFAFSSFYICIYLVEHKSLVHAAPELLAVPVDDAEGVLDTLTLLVIALDHHGHVDEGDGHLSHLGQVRQWLIVLDLHGRGKKIIKYM